MGNQSQAMPVKMLQEPIKILLFQFGIPTVFSVFVLSCLNLIDSYFAKLIGETTVGAVGVVFSLHAMIQAMGYFIGLGAGSLLSRELGKKEEGNPKQYLVNAIRLSLFWGIFITVFGSIFVKKIMQLLGASKECYEESVLYGRYIFGGALLILFAFVVSNLLRAVGEMKKAMLGIVIGVAANLVFHFLFVVVLPLGVHGIGIATLLGHLVSLLLSGIFLWKESVKLEGGKSVKQDGDEQSLSVPAYCKGFASMLLIMKVGLPSLFRQGTGSVAVAVMNKMAGSISADFQSAMAVSNKIILLLMSLSIGLSQAMQPLIGCNHGAKREERVRQTFVSGAVSGTVLMTLLAVITYFGAGLLSGWFVNEEEVQEMVVKLLHFQCMAMPFMMFANAANMLYQAVNRPLPASFIAALRQGIFLLPLLFLLPMLFQDFGLYIAQPLSDVLTFFACIPFVVCYFRGVKG